MLIFRLTFLCRYRGIYLLDCVLSKIADWTLAVEVKGVGGSDPNLQNKVVTPSSEEQYIWADSNYDGLQYVTVKGDSNLISSNIRKGKTIFGVTGDYYSSSGLTGYVIEHNFSSRVQSVTLDLTSGNSYVNNIWSVSFARTGYGYSNSDGDVTGAVFTLPPNENLIVYVQTGIKLGVGAIVAGGGGGWNAFAPLSQNRYLTITLPSFSSSSRTTPAYFTATKYIFNIVAYAW